MSTKVKAARYFPTVDDCLDYLLAIGCDWDDWDKYPVRPTEVETKLEDVGFYVHDGILVLHNPL